MPKQTLMRARKGELAKAMAEKDLTGQKLANRAGIGVMVVSRARNGGTIRKSTANAIAGALQVPLEQLFTDENGQALLPGGEA